MNRIDNIVHIDQIVERASEKGPAGLTEDAFLKLQRNAPIKARAVNRGIPQSDKAYAVFFLVKVTHPFRNGLRGAVEIGWIDRNRIFFFDQTMVGFFQLAVDRSGA